MSFCLCAFVCECHFVCFCVCACFNSVRISLGSFVCVCVFQSVLVHTLCA